MSLKLPVAAAVAVAALSLAGGATAATSHASCSDVGFVAQASTSTKQTSTALGFMGPEAYRSSEAWALRSWQTMKGTAPCRPSYQRFRQYSLNASAALWRASKSLRSGNLTAAESYLGQAGKWTDRAGAEQATWA